MTIREQISKRQESNFAIVRILEDMIIGHMRVDTSDGRTISLPEAFKELAEAYPEQRAGQIFCNYLCPDYRDEEVSGGTKLILQSLFEDNPDPFYEESVVTLKRLQKGKNKGIAQLG